MNKNLVNAHRKRTHLRNKFLKNRTENNRACYNKQDNLCAILLRKRKVYYGNLNEKDLIEALNIFAPRKKNTCEETICHS